MVTLWVGDFRTKQLQAMYKAAQQTSEYHFLIDDFAEYSWFANNIVTQLPKLSLEQANVVILLGFNDSVYSCVWGAFEINEIANQYVEIINSLVSDYPNLNFYTCSVNPINGDYPFATAASEVILKETLTEKIKLFNTVIKEKCEATYIDSYSYLTATNFETRDGVRYTNNTWNILHNYISNNITSNISAYFLPRITAPDDNVDSYTYWLPVSEGGENPYTEGTNASYAWGRFYEITGELPKLSKSNWYSYTADGYQRGSTPKVGAIACWTKGTTDFVAVVEQVRVDGSISTSESTQIGNSGSDNTWDTWQIQENRLSTDANWGMGSSYTFQGFIYSPQTESLDEDQDQNSQPKIVGFTLYECLSTRAGAAFMAMGSNEITYSLVCEGSVIKKDTIIAKPDFNVIDFENLVPDTSYTIKLEMKISGGSNIVRELAFTTPQDYPGSVSNIVFITAESKSFDSFTLTATKPEYLGHWRTNSGYDLQLIVNNKVVKTISVNNAAKDLSLTDFTLENKFSYTSHVSDNIQIGVRTWVKDDQGVKIYDNLKPKTSKSICLLNRSALFHLNEQL